MQQSKQNKRKAGNSSLARFAFCLGIGLICVTLVIGYLSYRYSSLMIERSYQSFYLDHAQVISNTVASTADQDKEKILSSLIRNWNLVENRPSDEHMCVVDSSGELLLHVREPGSVGSYAGDNHIFTSSKTQKKNIDYLLENNSNYVGEYIPNDEEVQIAAFVNMPNKDWLLGIHRSKSALQNEIWDGLFPWMIGFLFVCGALMPSALFLQYRSYRQDQVRQRQMEEDLIESEQRYQSLVDTIPQYMYRTDLNGNLTFANQALMDFLDCTHENCLGRPLDQIASPEFARKQTEVDEQIISSGQSLEIINEFCPDGNSISRYIELVKCPVFNHKNQMVELQGIFWDVTAKKHAEIRLEQMKAQLQTVLDSVPSGIVSVDSSGRITLVNQKAEEVLNINGDEAVGCPVNEVIPGSRLRQVLQNRQAEFGQHFAWGEKSLMVSRSPIHDEVTGIIGAVTVFQDVSELEQVQQQLDEMKQIRYELSLVIENSHDGILIANKEKVLKVNPSFRRITGLPQSAVEGIYIHDLDVESHVCLNTFKNVLDHVMSHGKSMTVRSKLKSDNEIFVTGTPVLDRNNQIVRVVINIRDVTELQTLEKQIKRLSADHMTTEDKIKMNADEGSGIVAESPETNRLLDVVLRVARVDSTVLLSGESGVGKDVFAGLIHSLSPRHNKSFVSLNCGAIPAELLESELFGYEKGAFSGANSSGKPGLFEKANGGCVYLDEIAELPLALQVKLLKVLQDQKCRRLGSVKDVDLNLRIIAATNKNLKELVQEEQFREDLFYRLYVVPLHIPPLRERKEDILPLATKFLQSNNKKYGLSKTLSSDLLDVLENYSWPGNIRELQNVIERMVVTADTHMLEPSHLPSTVQSKQLETKPTFNVPKGMGLNEALSNLEYQMLANALSEAQNTRQSAEILGITHSTVVRKAQKYKLYVKRARSARNNN